ncbi:26S proteasome non-ATPase regulatory subunit 4 homolog isoform X1, partial [Tanacetum coccineum]
VTMIIIDNSPFVPKNSDLFKTQYDAIRLYCRAKIKSNPENSVGAALFGYGYNPFLSGPSSDIEPFLTDTLG